MKAKKGPRNFLTQHHVKVLARKVHSCHKALQAALVVASPPPPAGWALIAKPDVKQPAVDGEMVKMYKQAFETELKIARDALASAFGSKPVRFVLPVTTSISTTTITGVVSATTPQDITLSPEFASLALLFDEYKFEKGKLEFTIWTPTPTIVLATSTITEASMFAIGWDPSDSTVATNLRDILQLEYHRLITPTIRPTATAGTFVGTFGRESGSLYELSWDYKDTAALTGNGGVVGPGMWKSTQGNVTNFPDGSLKPYYISGETTSKTCLVGVQYWTVAFRTRT